MSMENDKPRAVRELERLRNAPTVERTNKDIVDVCNLAELAISQLTQAFEQERSKRLAAEAERDWLILERDQQKALECKDFYKECRAWAERLAEAYEGAKWMLDEECDKALAEFTQFKKERE